jgi:chloramphenicol 3-O-phosphotransferase
MGEKRTRRVQNARKGYRVHGYSRKLHRRHVNDIELDVSVE